MCTFRSQMQIFTKWKKKLEWTFFPIDVTFKAIIFVELSEYPFMRLSLVSLASWRVFCHCCLAKEYLTYGWYHKSVQQKAILCSLILFCIFERVHKLLSSICFECLDLNPIGFDLSYLSDHEKEGKPRNLKVLHKYWQESLFYLSFR